MLIKLKQVDKDISASGKNGYITYMFVSLPTADGYAKFKRPEEIGGIVMDRATFGMAAADRHSSTIVECDLPNGALIKKIVKSMKGRSEISIEVVKDDSLTAAKYVGAKKSGETWDTVIELEGQRITIKG